MFACLFEMFQFPEKCGTYSGYVVPRRNVVLCCCICNCFGEHPVQCLWTGGGEDLDAQVRILSSSDLFSTLSSDHEFDIIGANLGLSYAGPLLSSMATRLLLNFHDQVSRTAHYPTDSPTTVCEGQTNAFSTVEFALPAIIRDVESASHDMDGTDDGTRTGDRDDEGNAFELKALKENETKKSTPSTGWLESEGMLTVPGRRLRSAAKADPG